MKYESADTILQEGRELLYLVLNRVTELMKPGFVRDDNVAE